MTLLLRHVSLIFIRSQFGGGFYYKAWYFVTNPFVNQDAYYPTCELNNIFMPICAFAFHRLNLYLFCIHQFRCGCCHTLVKEVVVFIQYSDARWAAWLIKPSPHSTVCSTFCSGKQKWGQQCLALLSFYIDIKKSAMWKTFWCHDVSSVTIGNAACLITRRPYYIRSGR